MLILLLTTILLLTFWPVTYGFTEELSSVISEQATPLKLITETQTTASLIMTILKVTGSLVLVVGLILLLLHLLKRSGLYTGRPRHGSLITVIDSCMVAPKKQVTLLDIGGEYIAVGITDQQINLLVKLENNADLSKACNKNNDQNITPASRLSFTTIFAKAAQISTREKRNRKHENHQQENNSPIL